MIRTLVIATPILAFSVLRLSTLTLSADGQLTVMAAIAMIFLAVFYSIIYFFFVKEYTGAFEAASRCGRWIPMTLFLGAGRGSYRADRFVLEIDARQGVI